MQLQAGPAVHVDHCGRIARCPRASPSSPCCSRCPRRVALAGTTLDPDDPPRRGDRLRRRSWPSPGRRTSCAGTRKAKRAEDAQVARVLRAADRPADRRRDVAGAGRLHRSGRRRAQSAWRPQEAFGAADVRPDRPQRQRQPDERREGQGNGKKAQARLRHHHRRPGRQPAAQRDALVPRRARTAAGSTRSPASRSAPPTSAAARRRTRSTSSTPTVAARAYTGVQDYDDWRGAPADRYAGFWDPDEAAPTAGPYAAFPRYPGLLERAQEPFTAEGLKCRWYIARGNHDGLVQGNAPASTDLFRAIAVGCLKVFPSAAIDPASYEDTRRASCSARSATRRSSRSCSAGAEERPAGPGPPHPLQPSSTSSSSAATHGYSLRRQGAAERVQGRRALLRVHARARARASSRSTRSPRAAARAATSTTRSTAGWSRRSEGGQKANQLVVAFGHHTLATMDNTRTDEEAGKCDPPDEPGCDGDPRKSTPIHLGIEGQSKRPRPAVRRTRT